MLIKYEDLNDTQVKVAQLLEPLQDGLLRGGTADLNQTAWERAYSGACRAIDRYDREVHALLESRGVLLRAYHCTRISDVEALRTVGLLRLDGDKVTNDLVNFAEQLTGGPLPQEVLDCWRVQMRRTLKMNAENA